jgi:hypothetical protein
MQGTAKKNQARSSARRKKLNSVGALMRGGEFVGHFEVAGIPYQLTYSPGRAAIRNGTLLLTGTLTVIDARPNARSSPRSRGSINSTLVGIQGGIGSAPPRARPPAEIYANQPGVPAVDSSGAQSFAGVLYLRMEPMAGEMFGLNADLRHVQLNARLFPFTDLEREIQSAYSQASDALLGARIDAAAANEAVTELNRLLTTR